MKPFSVRVRRAAGWRGVSYHETLQEALRATEDVQEWAVFFKGWKLTACNEPATLEQLNAQVEKLIKGRWFVRYYLSEWATSYNFHECPSKKAALKEAARYRRENHHSCAVAVFREPVNFTNCFFRSLDS